MQRMGAVQAQDYPGAKWAIGLRARAITDAEVERAFNEGRILRTHVLRPTWHFVAPGDIGWMLALSAPRIRMAMRFSDRGLGIDDELIAVVRRRLARLLRDGRHCTRAEVAGALARGGIDVSGQRLWHVMAHAEIDRVVCSGARRGKDHTYALFDTRAPSPGRIDRDEALGRLAQRYFESHGPATAADFGWWSGLTIGDARRGIDVAGTSLQPAPIDGCQLHLGRDSRVPTRGRHGDLLLPNFDEYAVAYKDRSQLVHARASGLEPGMGLLSQGLLLAGRFAGTWVRAPLRGGIRVDVASRVALSDRDRRAVASQVERYARFLDVQAAHRVSC